MQRPGPHRRQRNESEVVLHVHTATVVRVKDGEVTNSSGPFAESKVSLGGMWIIEAPDLDAAFVWAAKGSVACQAPVEVRPFGGKLNQCSWAMQPVLRVTVGTSAPCCGISEAARPDPAPTTSPSE